MSGQSSAASTGDPVLDTWVTDEGLQYVSLEKSPCGFVGTTSLVEDTTEPPYLSVQRPPGSRGNPDAEGATGPDHDHDAGAE